MDPPPRCNMAAFTRYINDDYDISLQFGVPPCPVCGNVIRDSDKAVQCYKTCKRWFHKQCINLRYSVYMKYEDKIKLRWSCERNECRIADVDDEFEDWTTLEGAELLVPDRDGMLQRENFMYPEFMRDRELFPMAEKAEKISEISEPRPKLDKELMFTPDSYTHQSSVNELLETYNKKFGKKEKKPKKKNEGTRMESIKKFFSRSDKSEKSQIDIPSKTEKNEKKTKKTKLARIGTDY